MSSLVARRQRSIRRHSGTARAAYEVVKRERAAVLDERRQAVNAYVDQRRSLSADAAKAKGRRSWQMALSHARATNMVEHVLPSWQDRVKRREELGAEAVAAVVTWEDAQKAALEEKLRVRPDTDLLRSYGAAHAFAEARGQLFVERQAHWRGTPPPPPPDPGLLLGRAHREAEQAHARHTQAFVAVLKSAEGAPVGRGDLTPIAPDIVPEEAEAAVEQLVSDRPPIPERRPPQPARTVMVGAGRRNHPGGRGSGRVDVRSQGGEGAAGAQEDLVRDEHVKREAVKRAAGEDDLAALLGISRPEDAGFKRTDIDVGWTQGLKPAVRRSLIRG